jgi:hypothetical protein
MNKTRAFLNWERVAPLDLGPNRAGICITGYPVAQGLWVVAPNPFDDERLRAVEEQLRRGEVTSRKCVYISRVEFERERNWN